MNYLRKNICYTIILCGFLVLILLFAPLAKEYAYLGLNVWYTQMIPSLLPFMIISSMIIKLKIDTIITKPLSFLFKNIFRISNVGIYVILMGFLCGFPMGAKVTCMELEERKITKSEAEFLISFCNNIGPVYFFSFVYGNVIVKFPISLCIGFMYVIPLLYGLLLRYTVYKDLTCTKENKRIKISNVKTNFFTALDESITIGLKQIASLSGYMIICNLFVMVPRLFIENQIVFTLTHCLLEINGGLMSLKALNIDATSVFYYAIIALSFTGISCHLQTLHIIRQQKLSAKKYMLHKSILCSITMIAIFIYVGLTR